MGHRTLQRIVRGVGLIAAAAISMWTVGLPPVAAQRAVTGVSTAQGLRVSYGVPGLLVVETYLDAGGPIAEARLGGAASQALASTLWPGDIPANYPQLAASVGMEAPPYPLMAYAEHPVTPTASAEGPAGYSSGAEAGPTRTAARSLIGDPDGPAPTSSVASTVEIGDDGTVTSRAESISSGLSLGDVLHVGSVRSTAQAVLAPTAQEPVVAATTVVEGLSVAGTAVELGPDGLRVAGTAAGSTAALAEPMQALAAAGLTIRLVRSEPVVNGAAADTVEIEDRRPLPFSGNPQGITRYRLGGATAVVRGEGLATEPAAAPDGTVPRGDGPVPVETPESTPLPATPSAAGPVPTTLASAAPVGLADPPVVLPAPAAVPSSPGADDAAVAAPVLDTRPVRDIRADDRPVAAVQWLLVAGGTGGLALFVTGTRKGAHRWSS